MFRFYMKVGMFSHYYSILFSKQEACAIQILKGIPTVSWIHEYPRRTSVFFEMTACVLAWLLCCCLVQCRIAAGMPFSPVDTLSDEDLPRGGQVEPAVDPRQHGGQLVAAEPKPQRSKKRQASKQFGPGDLIRLQHGLRRAVQSNCACKMSTCRKAFRDPARFEELVKYRLRLQEMHKMDIDKEVS